MDVCIVQPLHRGCRGENCRMAHRGGSFIVEATIRATPGDAMTDSDFTKRVAWPGICTRLPPNPRTPRPCPRHGRRRCRADVVGAHAGARAGRGEARHAAAAPPHTFRVWGRLPRSSVVTPSAPAPRWWQRGSRRRMTWRPRGYLARSGARAGCLAGPARSPRLRADRCTTHHGCGRLDPRVTCPQVPVRLCGDGQPQPALRPAHRHVPRPGGGGGLATWSDGHGRRRRLRRHERSWAAWPQHAPRERGDGSAAGTETAFAVLGPHAAAALCAQPAPGGGMELVLTHEEIGCML